MGCLMLQDICHTLTQEYKVLLLILTEYVNNTREKHRQLMQGLALHNGMHTTTWIQNTQHEDFLHNLITFTEDIHVSES